MPVASAGAAKAAVRLTRLVLTRRAVNALNRGRPLTSEISFSFTLSAAARVRATLMRHVRVGGHWRWRAVRGAVSIAGVAGTNRAHLRAHRGLTPGAYRLRAAPAGGATQSITLVIA